MNTAAPSQVDPPVHPFVLIVRASFIELIRRREFAVLLILMGLFFLGVSVARIVGIESPATASFLLNLGLTLAFALAQLLVILHSARQFPDELETRTLHPLLAKPITRGQYLVGKWLGSTLVGLAVLVTLTAIAWLPVPKLEPYSTAKLVQTLSLQVLAVAMCAALAQTASLLMPKAMATAVTLLVLFGGGSVINFLRLRADAAGQGDIVRWVTSYIPSLEPLDTLLPYTSGLGPEGLQDFGLRVVYGVIMTAVALALSAQLLHRRPL
jgi:ABC-type transport system involved in multi-copper enzyme maturation permease subunit